jgi:hypothetical protein
MPSDPPVTLRQWTAASWRDTSTWCRHWLQESWITLGLIWSREPWWAEAWVATTALVWGLVVRWTVLDMPQRPGLSALASMMGDVGWSNLAMTLGLLHLWASFCFWCFCGIVIIQAATKAQAPLGVPIYFAFYITAAGPCFYSALRLRWTIK